MTFATALRPNKLCQRKGKASGCFVYWRASHTWCLRPRPSIWGGKLLPFCTQMTWNDSWVTLLKVTQYFSSSFFFLSLSHWYLSRQTLKTLEVKLVTASPPPWVLSKERGATLMCFFFKLFIQFSTTATCGCKCSVCEIIIIELLAHAVTSVGSSAKEISSGFLNPEINISWFELVCVCVCVCDVNK